MVVPAGGAWLAVYVLLLLMLSGPVLLSRADISSSSASSTTSGPGAVSHRNASEQEQADMPAAEPYYRGQEDIQVGCRELRAKRYISDGFCTSIKPIKEVVCAGNCLPIRNLPWYAEFVKVWAKAKLREWQCEEDIVRRKTVSLLCRNGDYRTYRIKVVKSCKCKRIVRKHNVTVHGEGKKKKNKKKRKKDRRRRGKKSRRGERRSRKEEEEEEVDVSHTDQRQEGSRQVKERRGRRRNRKRPEEKREGEEERDLAPVQGGTPAEDSASTADSDRHKALASPPSR